VKLPKSKIIESVHYHEFQKRPFLLVNKDWFDSIWNASYSSFALIDAIGVRKQLQTDGFINSLKLRKLKASINLLAFRHRRHLIFSFADSALVKINWKKIDLFGYKKEYAPEELLVLSKKICELYKKHLGFESYVIATQGLLEDHQDSLYSKSLFGNHFSLGSLGTPFANLYEIEKAVKDNLKKDVHGPVDLYMSEDFCLSLKLHHEIRKDLTSGKINYQSSINPGNFNFYIPTSIDEVLSQIDDKKRKDSIRWRFMKRYLPFKFFYLKIKLFYRVGGICGVFRYL
ncbi:MAG: hypothetical protein Q7U04_15185, partial [Bacteriovorax sp.]|nr:hypothetical protein [Bacteriovorax sp.]